MPDQEPAILLAGDDHHLTTGDGGHGRRRFVGPRPQNHVPGREAPRSEIRGRAWLDAALSPRTASANAVLRQIRGGTASVATFLESDVEVDEFVIEAGSEADGALVAELHLPHSIVLGAVISPGEPGRIIRGRTARCCWSKRWIG